MVVTLVAQGEGGIVVIVWEEESSLALLLVADVVEEMSI